MKRAAWATRLAAIGGLLLAPAPALADLGWESGVDFFPFTANRWMRNSLGAERLVEARVTRESGRPRVHWRVVFLAANDRDAFAEATGVLELPPERAECQSLPLFAERQPRAIPKAGRRSYDGLSEHRRRLYPGTGSAFFSESVRVKFVPESVSRASQLCPALRDLCARRGGGRVSAVVPASRNLTTDSFPQTVEVDCSRLDPEEASCREVAAEWDRAWATAIEERRRRLESEWRCAALVHPIVEDDGSVRIVAVGRDGFSWGSTKVEAPGLAIRPSAWVLAPLTAVGDVGVMTAQALWTLMIGGRF